MARRKLFALAFVGLVVALLVASLLPDLPGLAPASPLPSALPFEHLLTGDRLALRERGHRTLGDAQALEAFWEEAGLPGGPPPVDFGRSLVVAVLMGEQATGGYRIRVTSVTRLGPEVLLGITEVRPDATCSPPPGPTQPFDIVAFPRGADGIVLLSRAAVAPC